jgi:predicted PurR-regulated permease PerM
MENQKFILDISWISIIKIAITIFVLYLLYLAGSLLVLFLFSLIISMLFNPIIDYFEQKRIPQGIGILLAYGSVFALLALVLSASIPLFVFEVNKFTQSFPVYFEKIAPPLKVLGFKAFSSLENFWQFFEKSLLAISNNIFNVLFAIFGGIFSTIFVMTTSIFLSLERKYLEEAIKLLSPQKYEEALILIWRKAHKKVAHWFLSRLLSSLFVAFLCYLVFLIFNIPYPISLALIAGLTNFIPYLGPIFSGVLIFLVSAVNDLFLGFLALVAFIIIQQIENNFLSPLLTRKFIGLPPSLTLMAFAFGGTLWGLMGAILALPLFAVIVEIIKEFAKLKKSEEATTD